MNKDCHDTLDQIIDKLLLNFPGEILRKKERAILELTICCGNIKEGEKLVNLWKEERRRLVQAYIVMWKPYTECYALGRRFKCLDDAKEFVTESGEYVYAGLEVHSAYLN